MYIRTALPFLLLVLLCGCAATMPATWSQYQETSPDLSQVRSDVSAYVGQKVLWGGTLVQSENSQQGAVLEVVHFPLDGRGKPQTEADTSQGRFLIQHNSYLETMIYSPGRKVTVAGQIEGSKIQSLQGIDYTYPIVESEDLTLWPKEPQTIRIEHVYPYGGLWNDPWYWRYPYW